ncbi:class I SAM-dependent methyltransferase [Lachnospiraceae bacterium]|nr:class I SAM-dependent methyltransferase [Lachnospiraceae bacterium]
MRIAEKITDIDYKETRRFFKRRAEKFSGDNPYAVTMYQDNNENLVRERNRKEMEKLCPLLKLDAASKVLDVACGVGRWADAFPEDIKEYCGLDFSKELITIANQRNTREHFSFLEGAAEELEQTLKDNGKGRYNRILLVGILIYLNDKEVRSVLNQAERSSEPHSVICIREPIGIQERLTLKDFFSEELKDHYNAIYRTRRELEGFLDKTLISKGFAIRREGFLFEEDTLNNRRETAQYFYILER